MVKAMRNQILQHLSNIEESETVKIIYACESGSRAWGFASTDSDYDVRFIYAHPPAWYLSIDSERRRDVLEDDAVAPLDLNGWDLKKALKLLRKSNPPLLEWLGSPIVYREEASIVAGLRGLLPVFYSPTACLYHYWYMALGNYRVYLQREVVWVKKYFYVLRPLLAIRWLERDLGVVPTEFERLVTHTVDSPELRSAIDMLISEKQQGHELKCGERIPVIGDFIESELQRIELLVTNIERKRCDPPDDCLNVFFRETLCELWPQAANILRPATCPGAMGVDSASPLCDVR